MLNLDTTKLTKIEQQAAAIEEASCAEKATLLNRWQAWHGHTYPKYAEYGPLNVALVCLIRQRYPDAGWTAEVGTAAVTA